MWRWLVPRMTNCCRRQLTENRRKTTCDRNAFSEDESSVYSWRKFTPCSALRASDEVCDWSMLHNGRRQLLLVRGANAVEHWLFLLMRGYICCAQRMPRNIRKFAIRHHVQNDDSSMHVERWFYRSLALGFRPSLRQNVLQMETTQRCHFQYDVR